jgi:hypothetical protein
MSPVLERSVRELSTTAGVEQAARRMRSSPASRGLNEFVAQWLRFDRVLNVVRDRRLFQQFNSARCGDDGGDASSL